MPRVGDYLCVSFFVSSIVQSMWANQAFCDDDSPGARCAKVVDNNGTHQGVDVTHNLVISAPVKVSLIGLEPWVIIPT